MALDVFQSIANGAGTVLNDLAGTNGYNSPAQSGANTTSTAPPSGNAAAPPQTKAFPLWGWAVIGIAAVLVLVYAMKRR